MQVFRAYFKITKKHIVTLLMYLAIFIAVSFIVTSALHLQSSGSFTETKSKIAFLNRDAESELTDGLRRYLADKAIIIDIADSGEGIQDSLFFGNVEYVLIVPIGFSESFSSGSDDIKLQRTTAAQSAAGVNVDLLVSKYLSLSQMYLRGFPEMPRTEIVTNVLANLEENAKVDFHSNSSQNNTKDIAYYFRFMAYSIMAILIMGITTIMLSFNETEFSKRNLCLPLSPAKISMQLFLGDIVLSIIAWAAICLTIFMFFGRMKFDAGTALLVLNSLVFTIATLGIAFLISKLIKSHVAMSAVTNIVTLGLSFISGVFVEQDLLGKTVTTVASFTPTYWYVKAIDDTCNISHYNLQSMQPLINDMLIQLGFAAALFIIAMVVSKQRKV
jgi:ABC-2 type transport system permease protein